MTTIFVLGVCRIRTRPCEGRRPGSIPDEDTLVLAWLATALRSADLGQPCSVAGPIPGEDIYRTRDAGARPACRAVCLGCYRPGFG